MKDMVNMTAEIIELSAKTLNRLCLDSLTNDRGEATKVLIAMCKSELPQLTYLDLQYNKFWWDDGNVTMLALFLGKLINLKHALLGWNNYLS